MKLADVTDVQLMLADYSRPTDVEAELVDVGDGTSAADYEGLDVRGKVVFARGSPRTVVRQAVFERGALGIVTTALRSTSQPWDHPDQIPWQSVPDMAPAGSDADGWFGFVLSARRGGELEALLAGRQLPDEVAFTGADPSAPVMVRVHVESSFDQTDMDTEFIEWRINGTDPSLPGIVFTCHIQEEKFSANDDASGCANVLEIGRALRHLVDNGMIPRPMRTLRFWSANEISGPYWYFRTHPDERDDIIVNLHQDMVGALQTAGSRVQHIIRSPHHSASYLADVVQSIAEVVIHGNSGYLAAGQAGGRYPLLPAHLLPSGHEGRLPGRDRAELQQLGPHGLQRRDHRHSRGGLHQLAGRLHPLFRRRPLADRPHAAQAERLHHRGGGALHRQRRGRRRAHAAGRGGGPGSRAVGQRPQDRHGHGGRGEGAAPTSSRRAMFVLEAAEMREQRAVASVLDFAGRDGRGEAAVDAALERVAERVAAFQTSLEGYYRSCGGDAIPWP